MEANKHGDPVACIGCGGEKMTGRIVCKSCLHAPGMTALCMEWNRGARDFPRTKASMEATKVEPNNYGDPAGCLRCGGELLGNVFACDACYYDVPEAQTEACMVMWREWQQGKRDFPRPGPEAKPRVADHGVAIGQRRRWNHSTLAAFTIVAVGEKVVQVQYDDDPPGKTYGPSMSELTGDSTLIADAPAEKAEAARSCGGEMGPHLPFGMWRCTQHGKLWKVGQACGAGPGELAAPTAPPKPQRRYVSSNGRDWCDISTLLAPDAWEVYPWRKEGEDGKPVYRRDLADARLLAQITVGSDRIARAKMDQRDMFSTFMGPKAEAWRPSCDVDFDVPDAE